MLSGDLVVYYKVGDSIDLDKDTSLSFEKVNQTVFSNIKLLALGDKATAYTIYIKPLSKVSFIISVSTIEQPVPIKLNYPISGKIYQAESKKYTFSIAETVNKKITINLAIVNLLQKSNYNEMKKVYNDYQPEIKVYEKSFMSFLDLNLNQVTVLSQQHFNEITIIEIPEKKGTYEIEISNN